MEQLDIKDIKIQQLEEEIKRLKEIIAYDTFNVAKEKPQKLIYKKKKK